MHMLEKLGSVSGSATLNIAQMAHYLPSTLFAVMKVTRTLNQNTNQSKNVLQQEHVATLVFNSMFHVREGIWTMQKVVLAHNHGFVSPNKAHMLRSQRCMTKADEYLISKMWQAGVKPTEIYDFFQRWSGGAENVQFLKMDCNNFIGRERKRYLEAQDAQTLLGYLENKQVEDPSFYYAVQLDKEDGRICNFFWVDGQAIADYACFGDVICVDTTFQTNKPEMPFAPIPGTNHHRQTIIFGAALLFDESADSFVWVFSNFMKAMSGKQPITIFTDQCAAMEKQLSLFFQTQAIAFAYGTYTRMLQDTLAK
jgi:zinc finger SWIM domain-containing protein 3